MARLVLSSVALLLDQEEYIGVHLVFHRFHHSQALPLLVYGRSARVEAVAVEVTLQGTFEIVPFHFEHSGAELLRRLRAY
jgi:hypothetical protein